MSDNFLQQVTLDCLVNKEQYNRHLANKVVNAVNQKDKKFYRKRVYNLTKELLLSKEEPHYLFPDVKKSFEQYVNNSIQYFKTLDNNDIIQSDYTNIMECVNIGANIPELNDDTIATQEEANKLLMRSIQMNHSLDKFIKRKRTKQTEQMILPKQKDINLQDPILKLKGVPPNSSKKKNIYNKYEDDKKKKETEKNTVENKNNEKNI
jgi:hypothetical protein